MKTITLLFVACLIAGCSASNSTIPKPKPVQAERAYNINANN